jgi:5-methyltetrahydrofolate--homocysteine methyltransferase
MEKTVEEIKSAVPGTKILIGGAPVSEEFKEKIHADFYARDPQGAVDYLNKSVA